MIRTCNSLIVLAASVVIFAQCSLARAEILTLATTTSTENSGLLAHVHPGFEKQTGIQVKVIAKGTGASLQLARDGNADVILVHAREKEDEFVREGYGVGRRDVMYNDFVIVGPKQDPAGIKNTKDAATALKKIAAAKQLFISRGDSSGTHFKEQFLWKQTKLELTETTKEIVKKGKPKTISMIVPKGDWYRSIGQGMGKTIGYTTEKQAYCLTDRGTYYAYSLGKDPRTDLVILSEGDSRLANPYGVTAVDPKKHPHVKHGAAMKYIQWLTSAEAQAKIGNFKKDGKVLFHPSAGQ